MHGRMQPPFFLIAGMDMENSGNIATTKIKPLGALGAFRKFFGGKPGPANPAQPTAGIPAALRGELGWAADSVIYSRSDFPKWDPDRLRALKGREIYRKMMHDDQVKAVVRFKQFAVIGRRWLFNIGTDEKGRPRQDHLAMSDFFTAAVSRIRGHFKSHLLGILSALENGFSITEKVFSPVQWRGRAMWGIDTLKLRPFASFLNGFEVDAHGNLKRLIQAQGSSRVEVPLEKVIHFVYQPDVDPHYGESDLRACYRAWWCKDIATKFQNIHLERHASGFICAEVNSMLSTKERSRLKDLLRNISTRMAAIVPGGVKLDAIQPLNTAAFENAIIQQDKAIAKAVLVPNLLGLSQSGPHGGKTQGNVQAECFFWVLDQIAKSLAEALNEQLFSDLARLNFGTDDFPLFAFEPISEEKKIELAKAWGQLVGQGAAMRSDSDEGHLRRLMNFPDKKSGAGVGSGERKTYQKPATKTKLTTRRVPCPIPKKGLISRESRTKRAQSKTRS